MMRARSNRAAPVVRKPLTSAQKTQLLEVAANSPISSVLRTGIAIQSAIID
jgi:hypothetical protein